MRLLSPLLSLAALAGCVAASPSAPAPEARTQAPRAVLPAETPAGAAGGPAEAPSPAATRYPVAPPAAERTPGPAATPAPAGTPVVACGAAGMVATIATGLPERVQGVAIDGREAVWVALAGRKGLYRLAADASCGWVAAAVPGTGVLSDPRGLASSPSGRWLYVADFSNNRIRRLDTNLAAPRLEDVAGVGIGGHKDGAEAWFYQPSAIAVADDGTAFVADTYNHRVRKIAPDGSVSTVAGTGEAGAGPLELSFPGGIAVTTGEHPTIFVSDTRNNRIVRIRPQAEQPAAYGLRDLITSEVVGNPDAKIDMAVIAGAAGAPGRLDRTGVAARFAQPAGLRWRDGSLYVADADNQAIRVLTDLDAGGATVATWAGGTEGDRDGKREAARFDHPADLAIAEDGRVFVADADNRAVRLAR